MTGAVVVGRYAGTVETLAAVLRGGGVAVAGVAAVDRDGLPAVTSAVAGTSGVAVVTAAPGDPTAAVVCAHVPSRRIVAVVWHPADERPALPPDVMVVPAGRVRATLAEAVHAAGVSSS